MVTDRHAITILWLYVVFVWSKSSGDYQSFTISSAHIARIPLIFKLICFIFLRIFIHYPLFSIRYFFEYRNVTNAIIGLNCENESNNEFTNCLLAEHIVCLPHTGNPFAKTSSIGCKGIMLLLPAECMLTDKVFSSSLLSIDGLLVLDAFRAGYNVFFFYIQGLSNLIFFSQLDIRDDSRSTERKAVDCGKCDSRLVVSKCFLVHEHLSKQECD